MARDNGLLSIEFVQKHAEDAFEYGIASYRESLLWGIQSNIRSLPLESPLEAAWLAWWVVLAGERNYDAEVQLLAQSEVIVDGQTFRNDFVIQPLDAEQLARQCEKHHLPYVRVAVELDGHEFHERTKEQVASRDRRDRALQAAGWLVLHYSGSEFHRSPVETVHGAFSAATSAFWNMKHRIYALEMTPDQIEREKQLMDRLFGKPGGA